MRASLEIDVKRLKKNLESLKNLSPSFFCPMLKANAYGHGSKKVASLMDELKIKQVGVVSLEEALEIKKKGSFEILIFSPLDKKEMKEAVREGFLPVISSMEELKTLKDIGKKAKLHLKVDTGFSRLGFSLEDIKKVGEILKKNPHLSLKGVGTQLIDNENLANEKSLSFKQLESFKSLKSLFKNTPLHVLNTAGLLSHAVHERKEDLGARVGIGIYGLKPEIFLKSEKYKKNYEKIKLSPCSSLKAQIVGLRTLKKGEGVSYGADFKAEKNMRLATVSLGYGDGFLRTPLKDRFVLFRGKKTRICGRICMDFFMIDVTNLDKEKEVERGEEVLIFGEDKWGSLSVSEQAQSLGTISYELFSGLSDRVKRVYKA